MSPYIGQFRWCAGIIGLQMRHDHWECVGPSDSTPATGTSRALADFHCSCLGVHGISASSELVGKPFYKGIHRHSSWAVNGCDKFDFILLFFLIQQTVFISCFIKQIINTFSRMTINILNRFNRSWIFMNHIIIIYYLFSFIEFVSILIYLLDIDSTYHHNPGQSPYAARFPRRRWEALLQPSRPRKRKRPLRCFFSSRAMRRWYGIWWMVYI